MMNINQIIKPFCSIQAKYISSLMLLLISVAQLPAQFTLDYALVKSKENSPLIKLMSISENEGNLKMQGVNMAYLPQIQISGQATYQSEVTSIDIPFPGIEIESPDKDQYKLIAEAQQNVYDGGMTLQRKKLQKAITQTEKTSLELEWRKTRKIVIQIYFGILELDSKMQILAYSKENINAGLKSLSAAVDNGVRLPSSKKEMEAGLILLNQQEISLQSMRDQLVSQLEILMGEALEKTSTLVLPSETLASDYNQKGLNYHLFDLQRELLDREFKLKNSNLQPRLGAFAQWGYGKPGYNFLSNEFNDFYMLGARASWNISAYYDVNRNRQLKLLGTQKIDQKKAAFNLQNNLQNSVYSAEINKLNALIATDITLVELRKEISSTASNQLENGVINPSEYLLRINEEKSALEMMETHKIQLIKSQYLQAHENEQ